MTTIKMNEIPAKSNVNRRRKKETEQFQQLLTTLLEEYCAASVELKGAELSRVFEMQDTKWRAFVLRWNNNPQKMLELRECDFEDLVQAYNQKIKQNVKNQQSPNHRFGFRSIIDRIRLYFNSK